jgi:hypothetical protein
MLRSFVCIEVTKILVQKSVISIMMAYVDIV